jgi:type 1 glutamine amidotransferase
MSFSLNGEPHQYIFDCFTEKSTLLEYNYGSLIYPAMWAHKYGWGRVVYMAFSCGRESLKLGPVKELMHNSSLWLQGKI